MASDGNWYRPEQHPDYVASPTANDVWLGPGWWMASDGNWYRPEQHPDYVASPEPAAKAGAAARGLPAATAAASAALSTASEAALEKVRRLGGMLDAGRLSDYEFQQMRKEILGL